MAKASELSSGRVSEETGRCRRSAWKSGSATHEGREGQADTVEVDACADAVVKTRPGDDSPQGHARACTHADTHTHTRTNKRETKIDRY